jgi:hypothetical protein
MEETIVKNFLLAALIILITACAPQTAEPTPTATIVPTATHTPTPEPTSTPTITPTPTPEPLTMDDLETMPDEDKFDLVPDDVEGERVLASKYFPNIVVLQVQDENSDDTKLVGYDLIKKEVVTLTSAGIFVTPTLDGTFYYEHLYFNGDVPSGIGDLKEAINSVFTPPVFNSIQEKDKAKVDAQDIHEFYSETGFKRGGPAVWTFIDLNETEMTWIGIGTVVDMNGEPTNMRFILVTTTDPETGGLKRSLIYVRASNFQEFLKSIRAK